MSQVELPVGKTYVKVSGNLESAKIAVVTIHGLSLGSYSYNLLAEELSKNASVAVVQYDLLGRGKSEVPTNVSYDGRLHVLQLEQLLCQLDLVTRQRSDAALETDKKRPQVVLCGYSMGGAVATLYCKDFPDDVAGVVLLAPAGLPMQMSFLAKLATAPVLGDSLMYLFGRKSLRAGFRSEFLQPEKHQETIEGLERAFDEQGEEIVPVVLNCLRHFPLGSLEPVWLEVAKHQRPVLVCWGDKDEVVSYAQHFQRAKAIFRNTGTFVSLPETKHSVLHTNPSEIHGAILKWLAEQFGV